MLLSMKPDPVISQEPAGIVLQGLHPHRPQKPDYIQLPQQNSVRVAFVSSKKISNHLTVGGH